MRTQDILITTTGGSRIRLRRADPAAIQAIQVIGETLPQLAGDTRINLDDGTTELKLAVAEVAAIEIRDPAGVTLHRYTR